jgi:hypothetical protein
VGDWFAYDVREGRRFPRLIDVIANRNPRVRTLVSFSQTLSVVKAAYECLRFPKVLPLLFVFLQGLETELKGRASSLDTRQQSVNEMIAQS